MTPLLVTCALCALGIAFALSAWRWLLRQSPRYDAGGQLAERVNREAQRYFRRQSVLVCSLAAVLGALVLLGYGVAYQLGMRTTATVRATGLWMTGAYFTGVIAALASSWVLAQSAAAATRRVVAEARRSLDSAVQLGLRAGAVPGMACATMAILGYALLCVGRWLVAGTFAGGAGETLRETMGAPSLLAGFALGYCFVALMVQLCGGVFGSVTKVAGDAAVLVELKEDEERPSLPGMLTQLVGNQVGVSAAGLFGLSAAMVVSVLASMLLAARLYAANQTIPNAVALILLPLIVAAFGLVASWFGVVVVRTDDTEVPMNAVARGMYVTSAIFAVAAAGCAKWLLPNHWLSCAVPMAIGVVVTLVCFWLNLYYTDPKFRPVRDLAKAAAAGPAFATLRGLLTALGSASAVVVLVAVGAASSYLFGLQSELTSGGELAVALMVAGMLGAVPYLMAMNALAHHAARAGGIIELTLAADRPDVVARARLLDALGTTLKAFCRQLRASAGTLTGLVLALVLLADSVGQAQQAAKNISQMTVLAGALMGILLVLGFVRVAVRVVVVAGRDLAHELFAASGHAPEIDGSSKPPSAAAAGYSVDAAAHDASAEMVTRVSLRGLIPPLAVGLGLPICVAAGLRIVASGDRVAVSAEALVAFLVVATVVGATTSLFAGGAGGAWDNAKKYIETGAHGGKTVAHAKAPLSNDASGTVTNPTYAAALVADTVGNPLAGLVGPALQTLLATLYALALVFLPFFS